jgi:hypothetical protein
MMHNTACADAEQELPVAHRLPPEWAARAASNAPTCAAARAARPFGQIVPDKLLALADQVIE